MSAVAAAAAAVLFAVGSVAVSSIGRRRYNRHSSIDAAAVRAQALADAWYVVHTARWGVATYGGPDSFYNGCKTVEVLIGELPGYDRTVRADAVSAYQIWRNSAQTAPRSRKLVDDPGGVGSTNRGLTPTNALDGSEG